MQIRIGKDSPIRQKTAPVFKTGAEAIVFCLFGFHLQSRDAGESLHRVEQVKQVSSVVFHKAC